MLLAQCKIVLGIFLLFGSNCRAHPEVYKPVDSLEDDELDDTSEEAIETAVKKGDEKLNGENDKKPIKSDEKNGGKPKQGDERKNENNVARSG
jgi:hypothetical protein